MKLYTVKNRSYKISLRVTTIIIEVKLAIEKVQISVLSPSTVLAFCRHAKYGTQNTTIE